MRLILMLMAALGLFTTAALAGEMRPVSERERFIDLVSGRTLGALGVSLVVSPDGAISGRAFGKSVSGSWRWQNGYFCRDLTFGAKTLPANCQAVQSDGSRIRFIADRGAGQRADLRLK